MILTVDIGNTNITLGGFLDDNLKLVARLSTDSGKTADEYAIDIKDVLSLNGFTGEITGAVISSVVPIVEDRINRALIKLYGVTPIVLGPGVKTGLNIKIDNPAQLGADLAAGAVGALAKYPLPAIIIDMGTATTLTVINKKGEFLGGAIAAGVGTTLEALTQKTTLLPSVSVKAPKKSIGSNTVECMQVGLVYGTASMIDGLIDRFVKELKEEKVTVIATGGRAGEIIKYCKHDIIVDENLLLDGLYMVYKRNA
ncbi:MAG: type III pantothenate kinase [Clostridia bacterium]|nr:type III pantothenate kinase [Clostridia bacterium]